MVLLVSVLINMALGIITNIAGTGVAGYMGDGGPATNALLHEPAQPFLDSSGNIYVTDYVNNVVRKIDVTTGIISTIAGTGVKGHSGDNGPALSANIYQPYGCFVD